MENNLTVKTNQVKAFKRCMPFFVFLIPSIALFIFAYAYPFFSGIHLAFTNWDGISQDYSYVGFKNFIQMFQDRALLHDIGITLLYAVLATAFNNILALGLALLLNKNFKLSAFNKTVFFIPMALSPVLASFIWKFIDSKLYAPLFHTQSLLANPKTVILGIIIIALWNGVGSNTMIYMAGLANIPGECLESAAVDGASGWKRLRYVILPLLGPSYTVCITLTLTSTLREFATVLSATGGGPARSSETVAIFIYNNLFQYYKAGYGQAVAIVFMAILVILGISLNRFFRSREVEF